MNINKQNIPNQRNRATNCFDLSVQIPKMFQNANIHLHLQAYNSTQHRIVLPRKQNTANIDNNKEGHSSKSANTSRERLQVNKIGQVQFSKTKRQKIKTGHIRTQSNCNYLQKEQIKEELSNFSNSLQNISQEVIQIPFGKVTMNHKTPLKQLTHRKDKLQSIIFNKNNSIPSAHSKPIVKDSSLGQIVYFQKKTGAQHNKSRSRQKNNKSIGKQNNCKEKYQRNDTNLDLKIRTKSIFASLRQNTVQLSDFSLKPIKITSNNSIVYLALHKKTGLILVIKSINKTTAKQNINDFIIQLKFSLMLQHPNIAKCYGFFSDKNNLYIMQQYLGGNSIIDNNFIDDEQHLSMTIKTLISVAAVITPLAMNKSVSINKDNLLSEYGVCKITHVIYRRGQRQVSFQHQIKLLLLQLCNIHSQKLVQHRRQGNSSIDSIIQQIIKKGSAVFRSFLEWLHCSLFLMEPLTQLLSHPFLRSQQQQLQTLQK